MTSHTPSAIFGAAGVPALADFWSMDQAARDELLVRAITAVHAYHYEWNTAYRSTVAARGVGPAVRPVEIPRLLRSTALGFKSYIDILGTPFAQDRPAGFVEWLADQVSVDLRPDKQRFRAGYRSLEGLLGAVERTYSRLGLELLTSSGTSGRTTVIPRDRRSTGLAAQSFSSSFQRYFGLRPEHTAVFMLPKRTRVSVTRMARYGVQRLGLAPTRMHFTVPFPASPDQVRVRTGRTYRSGLRGAAERRIWHPAMTTLRSRLVDARAVESAISHLIPASAHGDKVLLFGSLDQLHAIASFLLDGGRTMTLAPGSLLGTVGGFAEARAETPAQMRQDLRRAFILTSGEPAPIRDVYGLAEANWEAVQCAAGNYHIPPWVYAVTVDDQERFSQDPRSTGLLAFFDPYGGGELFPSFFRTADHVTLVRSAVCACGEAGSYLEEESIRRAGLTEDTACAGLM